MMHLAVSRGLVEHVQVDVNPGPRGTEDQRLERKMDRGGVGIDFGDGAHAVLVGEPLKRSVQLYAAGWLLVDLRISRYFAHVRPRFCRGWARRPGGRGPPAAPIYRFRFGGLSPNFST